MATLTLDDKMIKGTFLLLLDDEEEHTHFKVISRKDYTAPELVESNRDNRFRQA
ncbi:hypothetical protein BGP_2483 [Beggiatoa sp. PS]|nr:hypothetical protein BGP_2483 [Beggiatoa sp. PS]